VNGVVKIGIVVRDVERAVERYRELLGMDGWSAGLVDSQAGQGRFWAGAEEGELKASIAWIDLGGVEMELIQPLDSTIEFGRFLEQHGPGAHHIALANTRLRACMYELDRAGYGSAAECRCPRNQIPLVRHGGGVGHHRVFAASSE
jgi:methylmalonyl-CoA/ethylmalonyl-CoA epimerase